MSVINSIPGRSAFGGSNETETFGTCIINAINQVPSLFFLKKDGFFFICHFNELKCFVNLREINESEKKL